MLILITGLPGTGKTEIANFIISNLKIKGIDVRHYNSDSIRYKIYPELQNNPQNLDRDFTADELERTYNTLYLLIEEVLKSSRKVVIVTDGTYRSDIQRKKVKVIAEKQGHKFFMLKSQANEKEIISRSEKRLSKGKGSGQAAYFETKSNYQEPHISEYISIQNDGNLKDLEIQIETFLKSITS